MKAGARKRYRDEYEIRALNPRADVKYDYKFAYNLHARYEELGAP